MNGNTPGLVRTVPARCGADAVRTFFLRKLCERSAGRKCWKKMKK